MNSSATPAVRTRTREWPSFHGAPVPLRNDPFEIGQDFIRAMHHRICQPLTALSCTLEMIQLGCEADAKLTGQLQTAMAQSERVVELMGMFRQLFEAQTLPRSGHAVLIDPEVNEVVEDLRPLADMQRVSVALSGRSSGFVGLPSGVLRRILWSVIQNCIDLTPAKGSIRVEICACDVWVSDTSQLTSEEMENVLDPFSFCQNTSRATKVSNLPLALAYQIVSAAGGSLAVQPASDSKGRACHIRFPAADPESIAGEATELHIRAQTHASL